VGCNSEGKNRQKRRCYLHVFKTDVELVINLISKGRLEGVGQVLQGHVLQSPRLRRNGIALNRDAAEVGNGASAGLVEDAALRQHDVGRHEVNVDVDKMMGVDDIL